MTRSELVALLDRLRALPRETGWLEFKANRDEAQEIGEYLSALANSACLAGKDRGYLVFGVEDKAHDIVGTRFEPSSEKGKGNQDLLLWLTLGIEPKVGVECEVIEHPSGRVVLFSVRAAWDRPVAFYGVPYIRIDSSKVPLEKHPDKQRAILLRRTDWSAQICERASLTDLDPEAIRVAREQFSVKHPRQRAELESWDTATFLNKCKLTVQGAVTNAALLLVGLPESAGLLSPAVAKMSWILKDDANRELDYEHFGPPFLLNAGKLAARVRNLTLRTLPSGTLFPQEISQYDPWVLREALNNCIAHQDYGLHGRINVVESPRTLRLTNVGSFLPGSVDTVIQQDSPPEIYRNPFLAEAMVELNLIDTQGGGIKRMFETQARRSFPMPDYDLAMQDRVVVTIPGAILDEHYTRLLMERTDLDLWTVILLDRVQKRVSISREDLRHLRKQGLVEGRYPNLLVSAGVARATGQKARHIRDRGLEKSYYEELLLELIRTHGPVSREDIDALLIDKLPEVLTVEQKKSRVHNLLSALAREPRIVNVGNRRYSRWKLPGPDVDPARGETEASPESPETKEPER